ncbi:PP2C family serine/threonine-protein phosphatase [Lentzea sp. HUAS12]|uniref:PP2C family protein-serine/threonine phosphatase n=1 Tax=Lentzea sp. HUAS12 TaxID=2951806 RepID=UPI00209E737E|nr:protein phosphatase 2C domain-containing protein [Lentzea sp. HUAS12]USX51144.1 protein phosphatase 2C domain-containing protein [Lentzea sp. HUAS12]
MTHELRIAVATDPGLVREHNEDSVYVRQDLQAVADGMGGHEHGEVASALAVNVLADWQGDLGPAVTEIARRLDAETPAGAGTTLTAIRWEGLAFQLAHIGDSRAYVLREGELRQLSHDHTMVQALVDAGRMTPEEALVHPRRAYVLRALQSGNSHDPDLTWHQAKVEDRYLLCSDGLTDYTDLGDVHEILLSTEDATEAAWQLVALANGNGGPDNITCVIVDVVRKKWWQR